MLFGSKHIVLAISFFVCLLAVYYKNVSQGSESIISWPIFIATNLLSILLRKMSDSLLPASQVVLDDAMGAWRSNIQYTCSKLGIADFLRNGSKTIEELSLLSNVSNPENLQRLLRAATSMGYFKENLNLHTWENTKKSDVLIPDDPQSVYHVVRHWKEDAEGPWSKLYDSIKYDTDYDFLEGSNEVENLWEYYTKYPNQEQRFSLAMSDLNTFTFHAIVHDFNWGKFNRIVDIGGATGSLLHSILLKYPNTKGVLFDQPQVISKSQNIWVERAAKNELNGRYELLPGSFLDQDTLPSFQDGDCVLMRMILHDWSDKDSVTILKNIRKAIGTKKVSLSLVECVLIADGPISVHYVFDLHMKVIFNAKERYLHDWNAILDLSGFEIVKVNSLRSPYSVIEAVVSRS